MKTTSPLRIVLLGLLAGALGAQATIIEFGRANIIDDVGNPSHGLRYLDMSFSHYETEANALANAQVFYPNARLATPSEFDDLFAAAGITYNGAETASDGFSAGATTTITSGANYDGGALALALGHTRDGATMIWTDPDNGATRDFMVLWPGGAQIYDSTASPEHSLIGWLIVSEPAAAQASVGIPDSGSTLALGILSLLGLLGARRRRC